MWVILRAIFLYSVTNAPFKVNPMRRGQLGQGIYDSCQQQFFDILTLQMLGI